MRNAIQYRKRALALHITLFIATAHAGAAFAQAEEQELDEIIVTASPLKEPADDATQSVAVLRGKALENRAAGQLGQVISQIPGVQSTFFSAGVARPVIRGLDGSRVQTLSDGISSMDAASSSVDHATPIEPILVDQIEILKGPATLLFGSGSIGGVVNVDDGRLPETAREGLKARAQLGSDTASELKLGALRLDYGAQAATGTWQLHLDAASRKSDDYEIPGAAVLGELEDSDVLESSSVDSTNGAVSATYLADSFRIGLALSRYETLYGIPEAGEEEEEGAAAISGRSKSGGEEGVQIDLEQDRIDLKGAVLFEDSWIKDVELRLGRNDYEHVELEGDEQGTLFEVDEVQSRLEALHQTSATAWGELKGAFGITYSDRDFAAIGEEAFVPGSNTSNLAAFYVAHIESDENSPHLDFGLRFERVELELEDGSAKNSDSLHAFSLGAAFPITPTWDVRASLDLAERAPTAEERYSDGAHIATQSFELGDADLDTESSKQIEIGLHHHGERSHFKLAVFNNRFNDFIYQQPTGDEEDGLPVFLWTQDDAQFKGAEFQFDYRLLQDADLGQIGLRLQGDRVRGRLDDAAIDGNRNLPRIAPSRLGIGLNWERGAWQADAMVMRHQKQDQTAAFETETDAYNMVDLDFSRSFGSARAERALVSEIYLQIRNIGDQEARVHTSYLKDVAPLPGRNIGFGMRFYW